MPINRREMARELRGLAQERYPLSNAYLKEKDQKKREAIVLKEQTEKFSSIEWRVADFLDKEQDAIDTFLNAEHTHSVSMDRRES